MSVLSPLTSWSGGEVINNVCRTGLECALQSRAGEERRADDNNGERLEASGSIMLPGDERNVKSGMVPSVPSVFVSRRVRHSKMSGTGDGDRDRIAVLYSVLDAVVVVVHC